MIKMYISKDEDGHILMAKPDDSITNYSNLKDVVKIVFMQTGQGIAPIPCYYPNIMLKDIVKQDFINGLDVIINTNDYIVIDEEHLVNDIVALYRKEMGRRTGIELITTMPTPPSGGGLRLVR